MKRFIKFRFGGLGVLFILVVVFIIWAICGIFRGEHRHEDEIYSNEKQIKENETSSPREDNIDLEEWIEEPDTIPGVSDVILHRLLSSRDMRYYKRFNSKGSQRFYYNRRHGYYVLLPKDMGYIQLGEHELGAHWNEFYNRDTTLVIACGAMFYDVVLLDYPHWEDTLKNDHLKRLEAKGKVEFLSRKPNEIVAKVFIDRTNKENPPSDYLLSKWILKKDIDDRECEMTLDIWYNDSLKNQETELLNIINKFPDNPFNQ